MWTVSLAIPFAVLNNFILTKTLKIMEEIKNLTGVLLRARLLHIAMEETDNIDLSKQLINNKKWLEKQGVEKVGEKWVHKKKEVYMDFELFKAKSLNYFPKVTIGLSYGLEDIPLRVTSVSNNQIWLNNEPWTFKDAMDEFKIVTFGGLYSNLAYISPIERYVFN